MKSVNMTKRRDSKLVFTVVQIPPNTFTFSFYSKSLGWIFGYHCAVFGPRCKEDPFYYEEISILLQSPVHVS